MSAVIRTIVKSEYKYALIKGEAYTERKEHVTGYWIERDNVQITNSTSDIEQAEHMLKLFLMLKKDDEEMTTQDFLNSIR